MESCSKQKQENINDKFISLEGPLFYCRRMQQFPSLLCASRTNPTSTSTDRETWKKNEDFIRKTNATLPLIQPKAKRKEGWQRCTLSSLHVKSGPICRYRALQQRHRFQSGNVAPNEGQIFNGIELHCSGQSVQVPPCPTTNTSQADQVGFTPWNGIVPTCGGRWWVWMVPRIVSNCRTAVCGKMTEGTEESQILLVLAADVYGKVTPLQISVQCQSGGNMAPA